MASLLDIGPLTEKLTIRGQELEFRGLNAAELFGLFVRFPDLRALLDGAQRDEMLPTLLQASAPKAVGAVFAIANGYGGNQTAEANAERLAAAEQVQVLRKVLNLTFPQGIVAFADLFRSLMDDVNRLTSDQTGNESKSETAGDQKDDPQASVPESQKPSSIAFSVDIPPRKPGGLRRVS